MDTCCNVSLLARITSESHARSDFVRARLKSAWTEDTGEILDRSSTALVQKDGHTLDSSG